MIVFLFPFLLKQKTTYGSLTLEIKNELNDNYILELRNEKNKQLYHSLTSNLKNNNLTIEEIPPGNYYLVIIIDKNNNKKRDTGSFLEKIQPENVIYPKKSINIRSNWFITEQITIK